MHIVPATKTHPVWRALILLFATLLTFGVLAPTASAGGYASLRVHDKSVVEGDHGVKVVHVKITLSKRVHHKVSVGWFTKEGTAKAWKDFKPTAGRAFFPKGHKVAFAHVKVKGDKKVEPNEYFKVKLVKPHGAKIADGYGKVWIVNDDKKKKPKLFVLNAKVTEGETAKFKVCLTKRAHWDVTFDYATKDKTAKAGKDYTAASGPGEIAKGTRCTKIAVETLKDKKTDEGKEKFVLKVFNVKGAWVIDGRAKGIILDGPAPTK